MPASCATSATRCGLSSRLTPSLPSTSEAPEAEDAARLPCLTTVAPVPATTIADMVEMLTVRAPSEHRTGPFRCAWRAQRSVVAVAARDLLVLLDGRLRDLGLLAVVRLTELGAQLLGALDLALDAVLVDRRADLVRLVLLVRGE